jgi:2-polyprenyl-3-methyl-5-hydroxy-6-metoxy-1,4-benzoquinol methylase
MSFVTHSSAKPSHYDEESLHYDAFNEENSKVINRLIEKICAEYKVSSILDLTCGTGSQVFWLARHGYKVVGSDINQKMLKLAKARALKEKLDIQFVEGDMRTSVLGKFDAVVTIFNAIGHLTKQDFELAMQNIHSNLNYRGLYIFDIFNLSYLLEGNNITKLTIDEQRVTGDMVAREIQYSTIDAEGILASYDIYHRQQGSSEPEISTAFQTLQVYSAGQLKNMLQRNGFEVLDQCDVDGATFIESASERIFTVARKI